MFVKKRIIVLRTVRSMFGEQTFAQLRTGLTSSKTIRLIRHGEKAGGGKGMEVGEEGGRLYTYRYTVTTRMTPELRWAAMRAILMFH